MQPAKQTERRDPEIRWYFPIWCHGHGAKMRVKEFNNENSTLVIAGSAAKVTIRRAQDVEPQMKNGGWFVDWEVIQYRLGDEWVRGRRLFTDEELSGAFGLTDSSGKYGQHIINRFGADSAEQGLYIRWRNFLNIPCPGTGHDGDPNVSIHLDAEIQNAVLDLLR